MDELDEEIIANVDTGTIKSTSLAKKLNAPLSTVHFRLKRLEKEQVIKYYKGEIDWKKAGFTITAFVLVSIDTNLMRTSRYSHEELLKDILSVIYVREGYITTSEADMILKVIAKDTAHLREILLDYVFAKKGVVNTKTMIVLG